MAFLVGYKQCFLKDRLKKLPSHCYHVMPRSALFFFKRGKEDEGDLEEKPRK